MHYGGIVYCSAMTLDCWLYILLLSQFKVAVVYVCLIVAK